LANGGDVGIFDATNSVSSRRGRIVERFKGIANVVFVEVICDDEQILEENLIIKVRNSPDFAGMDLEEALSDLRKRIDNYTAMYEPLNDDRLSYIKLYNLSSKILANKVYGRITSSILPYLVSLHVGSRPIWLVRAGLAKDFHKLNLISKDGHIDPSTNSQSSPLGDHGRQFAQELAQWIRTALWMRESNAELSSEQMIHQQIGHVDETGEERRSTKLSSEIMAHMGDGDPELVAKPRANSSSVAVRTGDGQADKSTPIKVLCSTLPRAEETARIALESCPGSFYESRPLLNPLNKGEMNGLSIAEIRERFPQFVENWEHDPFHGRFPGGESYCDMITKLKSVLIEIEQQTAPVLVVSHVSCIQVLLAYYLNIPVTKSMDIEVPLHTVIELQPMFGGSWKEVRYPLLPQVSPFHLVSPMSSSSHHSSSVACLHTFST